MSNAERGYASLAIAEPHDDWDSRSSHVEQSSAHSSTVYPPSQPAEDVSEQHSTLYEHYRTRGRVSWDRLRGKGRNVPGWRKGLLNVVLSSPLNLHFVALPFAWASHFMEWSGGWTYYLCIVALIPLVALADWTGEQMSLYLGEDLGDFVVITLNNAIEATLAIVLLRNCELRLLHATIIGVILLHLLLVPGVTFLTGGAQVSEQNLHPHRTQLNHSLLAVGVLAILLPTAFFAAVDRGAVTIDPEGMRQYAGSVVSDATRNQLLRMSRGLAIVLLVVYIGSRVFVHYPPGESDSPKIKVIESHTPPDTEEERQCRVEDPEIGPWLCLIVMVITVSLMAVTTEFLVEANEFVREYQGIGHEWFGLIFLPLISFAADALLAINRFVRSLVHHFTGKKLLQPQRITKARTIDLSIQFTLFWMPLLVLLGWCMQRPMHLLFDYYELAVILGSCFLVNYVTADSKTNWAEGVVLMAFYIMIAIVTWFYDGQPELDIMAVCPGTVAEALYHGVSEHHNG